ncbi:hypothetical protein EV426DRAFT_168569 [Tirmania nivea]|nr:hypothetical protein EV426DRAFT_168569 [Tirmania nivea]
MTYAWVGWGLSSGNRLALVTFAGVGFVWTYDVPWGLKLVGCRGAGDGSAREVQLQNTRAANVIERSGIKVLGVLRGGNEARVSGCMSTCGRRLDTAAAAGGAMPG